jgi:monoamine oxidase
VIVIGAGLSGLNAAMILADQGLDVLVLEASTRIGGRMKTLDALPGRPEAGGQQVGAGYGRVRGRAADAGLTFEDFPPNQFGQLLALGDTLIPAEDWAGHPLNALPERLKPIPPSRLFFSLAARANPFEDLYAWLDPGAAAHDVSAERWLQEQGANDEALRLMNVSLNGRDLSSYSMINVFRSLALYTQERSMGPSQQIAGGSQRLPEAMAASLPRPVRTGASVTGIEADGSGARVQLESGEALRADFLVSSLPFPVMRRMGVEAPLSALQREAIEAMAYTPIVQLHLEAETPFWEADGLPPEMWTDSPLERVFAGRTAEGTPDGRLTCWLDGLGGLSASPQDDAALEAMAQAELARLRPASEGRVRLAHVQRWTEANPLAGGAYMHYQPGQAPAWGGQLAAPAGRLHLAGEHLGVLHTGMEAAMEAGENAAMAILEAAGA